MYKTHTLRKGRISEENRVYLITVVTHNRQRLFMDWPGARPVIHALRAADLEAHTSTHAWVLMPDHLHWLCSLRHKSLGSVVGRMKSRSTVVFNKNREGTGPLWQKGYHDRALRNEDSVLQAARYVVANPLRAGLVASLAQYPLWDEQWVAAPLSA